MHRSLVKSVFLVFLNRIGKIILRQVNNGHRSLGGVGDNNLRGRVIQIELRHREKRKN